MVSYKIRSSRAVILHNRDDTGVYTPSCALLWASGAPSIGVHDAFLN